jgi:hypothetical protein
VEERFSKWQVDHTGTIIDVSSLAVCHQSVTHYVQKATSTARTPEVLIKLLEICK